MAIESVTNMEVSYQGRTTQKESLVENSMKIEESQSREAVVSAESRNRNLQGEKVLESITDSKKGRDQNSQIKKAVDEINRSIRGQQTEAIFGIHDDTNRVTIKIVDKKSKEVIKEFPPEQTLDMIAKVWEMAGIMVDEKG